ncbi:MAG TPA: MaoC family dehydratase N-terminal domain-containing protein [Streptosporangiaceae bacterium]
MPEAEVETLVTPEMEERKGVWGSERVSYPVSESDIRKWAIAVYWGETPPRLYWDEEYAKTTRWGGIIAPQDFNPFAWAVPMGAVKPAGAVPGQQTRKGGNVMNGGQKDTYGVPMRPGDVITSRSRLSSWEERQGRNGLTLFTYTETEWRNQDGELVKTRISTGIRY